MRETMRKAGIEVIGNASWGTHFCLFYHTREDLIDILVPYFKAGLENNEFCMWVTSEPLEVEDAKTALNRVVKNLDDYIEREQIEVIDYSQWRAKSGKFGPEEVLQGWVQKEKQALKRGFDGLRLTGNTFWLEKRDWKQFADYEAMVDNVISEYRMIAICTYSLDRCGASEVIDVVSNHQFALIKREGKWESIESAERKRAEEALPVSEEKYRSLVESTEDSIYLVDRDCRYLFMNEKHLSRFDLTLDEVTGRSYGGFHSERETREFRNKVNEVLETGKSLWHEYRSQRDGGYFLRTLSPVKEPDGRTTAVTVVSKGVTERKRAEEALRTSQEYARSIIDSSLDMIITVDTDRCIVEFNKSAEKTFGYGRDEVMGTPVDILYANPQEGLAVHNKTVQQGQCVQEILNRRKNGEVFPSFLSASLLHDTHGELLGVMGVSRDITERKQLEEQLLHAQKMEAMGTLAGGIAHDFNNLLMGIEGNASLMLSEKTPDHPDYERLKNIEQGVKSGAQLTRQLLGFAMGGRYEVKPTDINELIKRSSDMFGRTKKEIAIHTKYQEGIWPVEVDQGQIEQVLVNLYVNAWQAMPGGGELYLETENITLDEDHVKPYQMEPGRYVKISLTDTGVGMDEATQKRLFEPFFTTKEMGRGTGLGLASVYGIVRNHGGIINVYSVKGEGATFTIYLPASEKEVIKEEELPKELVRGTETLLLVDDEEMVLEVGEELLKELGYKVLVARSGKEAIELYKANKSTIDIVILDMIMPVMGGGETYDRLKEINPNIKVLLSSGYSIDGQAREILDRGCNGFIQKPFNMRELSQEVRKILDTK